MRRILVSKPEIFNCEENGERDVEEALAGKAEGPA
jgi:hypothetical protein